MSSLFVNTEALETPSVNETDSLNNDDKERINSVSNINCFSKNSETYNNDNMQKEKSNICDNDFTKSEKEKKTDDTCNEMIQGNGVIYYEGNLKEGIGCVEQIDTKSGTYKEEYQEDCKSPRLSNDSGCVAYQEQSSSTNEHLIDKDDAIIPAISNNKQIVTVDLNLDRRVISQKCDLVLENEITDCVNEQLNTDGYINNPQSTECEIKKQFSESLFKTDGQSNDKCTCQSGNNMNFCNKTCTKEICINTSLLEDESSNTNCDKVKGQTIPNTEEERSLVGHTKQYNNNTNINKHQVESVATSNNSPKYENTFKEEIYTHAVSFSDTNLHQPGTTSSQNHLPVQSATSDYSSLSSNNSQRDSVFNDSPNNGSCSRNRSQNNSDSGSSSFTYKLTPDNSTKANFTNGIVNIKKEKVTEHSPLLYPAVDNFDEIQNSIPPLTPTGSCLKWGPRTLSTAHVQFDTTDNNDETLNLHNTLMFSDDTFAITDNKPSCDTLSKSWCRLHVDSVCNESSFSTNLKSKHSRRHPSGSSVGSNTSSLNDSETTEFERQAPDGGWGWVIVMASFFVHCIADGVTMSFGVLFVEFLSYFKESKSLTSWVGSLFMAIPLLAGPIASVLTDRYGCRSVTIWGSVIASFGFFISAFSNSLVVLFITIGVITGLGLAVCYVAAIVIVAFYFEKKRSLATGIAVAGSGIGTFLFAPLIQYLIEHWGWRGCLVILAGIFLNMAVCGALMRDLEWKRRHSNRKGNKSTAVSSRRGSTPHSLEIMGDQGCGTIHELPSLNELRKLVQSGDIEALLSPEDPPQENIRTSASLVQLPTFLNRAHALPPDLYTCFSSRTNAYEVVSQMYPHLLSRSLSGCLNKVDGKIIDVSQNRRISELKIKNNDQVTCKDITQIQEYNNDSNPCIDEKETLLLNDRMTSQCDRGRVYMVGERASNTGNSMESDTTVERGKDELKGRDELIAMMASGNRGCNPTLQKDQQSSSGIDEISTGCMRTSTNPPPSEPLRNMRINRQSMTFRGAMLNIHRYRLRASSCPDIYRNSIITIAKGRSQAVWTCIDEFREMAYSCVDVSYCSNPAYVVFATSNFILYVFYDTVYMYLTDYAQDNGVPAEDAANLISAIGILNCVGMVGMGYVGDKSWSSPILIYNISMILCGISVMVMPLISNYWTLATAAAIFGLFISANYALTSVILVELVSLELFSKAYGLLLLIQGVANLIGPPIVGLMADKTGNYMLPFVISGIFIIICGVMLSFIPVLQKCQAKYAPSRTPSPPRTPSSTSRTHSPSRTRSPSRTHSPLRTHSPSQTTAQIPVRV